MADRIATLQALFEPVVAALGCDIWGIEYNGQGKYSLLRVYIEKDGGVSVDDCADVSRQISGILDVEDPIKGEYTLEVSSPGLDRPLFSLSQYAAYVGYEVALQLRVKFENRRKFSGVIRAVENDEVIIVDGEDQYALPFELIEKANLVSRIEK